MSISTSGETGNSSTDTVAEQSRTAEESAGDENAVGSRRAGLAHHRQNWADGDVRDRGLEKVLWWMFKYPLVVR